MKQELIDKLKKELMIDCPKEEVRIIDFIRKTYNGPIPMEFVYAFPDKIDDAHFLFWAVNHQFLF